METVLKNLADLDWNYIKFARTEEAVLIGFILGAVFISALIIKYFRLDVPGRNRIVIPAILPVFKKPRWKFVRHIPRMIFYASLAPFFIALADPYTSFVKETVTYPGRRIAVLIDASGSMTSPFKTDKFKKKQDQGFYTAIAAAEYFMKLRVNGKYNDLMALIEFGNESYIITPFTNDYKNILTSITLISEPEEWNRFPDKGTTIIKAIDQSIELFQTFGFLKAAGNLIVLISDGEDVQFTLDNRPLDDILGGAIKNQIPIYFIRTNYDKVLGGIAGDNDWKKAVEKTGGKFYPAPNEAAILQAVNEIDQATTGSIDVSRYVTKKPLFSPFLAIAVSLWAMAGLLTFSLKIFNKFP